MERNLKVKITDKIAVLMNGENGKRPFIVCDNTDYSITFLFDDEWDLAGAKTARFTYRCNGKDMEQNIPFTGDTVEVPALSQTLKVEVGVFAGNLKTSTSAEIGCLPSALSKGGKVPDPEPEVYNEIMELINGLVIKGVPDEKIMEAVNQYLDENGINTLPAVTDDDNGKVLQVEDGKWIPKELPKSGGSGESNLTVTDDENGNVSVNPKGENIGTTSPDFTIVRGISANINNKIVYQGSPDNNVTRIRACSNPNVFPIDNTERINTIRVTIPSGFCVGISAWLVPDNSIDYSVEYGTDKTFEGIPIRETGWQEGHIIELECTSEVNAYRINIKRSDNAEMTDEDISTLSAGVAIEVLNDTIQPEEKEMTSIQFEDGTRYLPRDNTKVSKSGWSADKYLGTDENGNVIEKEIPENSGGNPETSLLADFTVEKDISGFGLLNIPLSEDPFDFKSILITMNVKCADADTSGNQFQMYLINSAHDKISNIAHLNTIINNKFSDFAIKADLFYSKVISIAFKLDSYQWTTTNRYSFSWRIYDNPSESYMAQTLAIRNSSVGAGSRFIVEGVR
ncbi:MAG: hypothetical protein PUC33_01490 [Oscillospiraceae bacterium]|nr:hypothetical protein [Oscillospiraceae bacterium]